VRLLYLTLAALSFLLAVLGFALPVLPGTPFLLITSWCLARSSPALQQKLRRSVVFGPILRDWDEHHGVRPHVKLTALATLMLGVAASLVFGNLGTVLTIVLVAFGAVGAVVVLRLRTIHDAP
jgi:uncharacterized membrane protein YbaN (DUF454 family)